MKKSKAPKSEFDAWFEAQFGKFPNSIYKNFGEVQDAFLEAEGRYFALKKAYEQVLKYEENFNSALYGWRAAESSRERKA